MRIMKRAAAVVAITAGLFWAQPADAQWMSQTLVLKPGWNAVYLEVAPGENDCDALFGGLPINSVWAWVKEFSPAQFVRNPNELTPELPDWLVYFPEDHPKRFLRSLHSLIGGRCYLIDVTGKDDVSWTVTGRAVMRGPEWLPDSFNLVGFHLDPSKKVKLQQFLAPAPNLAAQQVYRTTATGESELIAKPADFVMKPGEAYWIFSKGGSDFAGPFKVEADSRDGLEFGKSRTEQRLRLVNKSSEPRTVTIRLLPSQRTAKNSAGRDAAPAPAGPVELSFQRIVAWHPLDEALTFTIEAGQTGAVPLAVRRAAMASPGSADAVFESVLEVKDDSGMRYWVPVTASKAATPGGLWVGNVRVDAISEAGNPQDSTTPRPTDSEFQFRLIVHVDGSGQARLLQNVTLLQAQETQTTPARYVLITRDDLLDEYKGVSVRGDKIVGRRISSPAFGFRDPILLAGSIEGTLNGVINVDYDDPLNPFVHRYHPDHNNLDERYQTTLAAGRESFTFSRSITLEFTEQDPENMGLPEWGDEVIGGIYKETMIGVHQQNINVQGTFLLNKVTEINVLNDGR